MTGGRRRGANQVPHLCPPWAAALRGHIRPVCRGPIWSRRRQGRGRGLPGEARWGRRFDPEVWGMDPKISVSMGSRGGGVDTSRSGVCKVSVTPVRAYGSSCITRGRWRSGRGGGRVSTGAVVVESVSMTCRLAGWSRDRSAKATKGRVGRTDTTCGARVNSEGARKDQSKYYPQ